MFLRCYEQYIGLMAEWLCTGLQIRLQRFDSASGLHNILQILLNKYSAKEYIVRNFLYTIRTQNIGVDFYFLTLVDDNSGLGRSNSELKRRIDTN